MSDGSINSNRVCRLHRLYDVDAWKEAVTQSHTKLYYGLVDKRGRIYGGISNPHLFSLEQARLLKKKEEWKKIVGIRVTHEVVSEVVD